MKDTVLPDIKTKMLDNGSLNSKAENGLSQSACLFTLSITNQNTQKTIENDGSLDTSFIQQSLIVLIVAGV